MPDEIDKLVFLIGGPEGHAAVDICMAHSNLPHIAVTTHEELERECTPHTRLIVFASGVIVKPDLLAKLKFTAYNIHPGPPEYPGIFPSVFAIYDGQTSFGTTVHELKSEVDTGDIIYVDRFDMPENPDRMRVDMMSYQSALRTVDVLASDLVLKTHILPTEQQWNGPRRRQIDFNDLCKLPNDVSAEEFDRRYRAVGEGPNHALEINLFGHRFELNNNLHTREIVKAGQTFTDN